MFQVLLAREFRDLLQALLLASQQTQRNRSRCLSSSPKKSEFFGPNETGLARSMLGHLVVEQLQAAATPEEIASWLEIQVMTENDWSLATRNGDNEWKCGSQRVDLDILCGWRLKERFQFSDRRNILAIFIISVSGLRIAFRRVVTMYVERTVQYSTAMPTTGSRVSRFMCGWWTDSVPSVMDTYVERKLRVPYGT